MWAAGYGSTVRAVRCADLVLPLRPKDDPTDKFDDAVEFVRQLVTFLEVASSAAFFACGIFPFGTLI